MAVAQPDELLEPAVRRLAVELGVPDVGKNKTEMVADIQAQYPNISLILVPMNAAPPVAPKARRDWLGIAAVLATALTALFTVAISWANWKSAEASQAVVMQSAADKQNEKKTSWQAAKIYEIIDDAGKDVAGFRGLAFDDIMTRYRSAAQEPEMEVKIGKEELHPFHLRKLLIAMQETGLIYRTFDDKYVAQRTAVNTREEILRSQAATRISTEIVKILHRKGRPMSEDDLGRVVKDKFIEAKLPWNDDDYLVSLINLCVGQVITIDDKGSVSLSVKLPPK